MRALGLDLGTKVGWAVTGGPSGVTSFATKDRVCDEVRHGRLGARFSAWLSDMISTYEPAVLVLERVVGTGLKGHAAQVLPGLRMAALASAYLRELAVQEISPRDWQAWAKSAGYPWKKGDQADAKALLACWLATRAGEIA